MACLSTKKSFICVSKILFLNCMCVHVCLLTHTCIGIVPIKVSVLTKARVKGSFTWMLGLKLGSSGIIVQTFR